MASTVQGSYVRHVVSEMDFITLFILEIKKLRLRKVKNLPRVLQSDKAGIQTEPISVKPHHGFFVFVLGVNFLLFHPNFRTVC